jgi:hypothetical protein
MKSLVIAWILVGEVFVPVFAAGLLAAGLIFIAAGFFIIFKLVLLSLFPFLILFW